MTCIPSATHSSLGQRWRLWPWLRVAWSFSLLSPCKSDYDWFSTEYISKLEANQTLFVGVGELGQLFCWGPFRRERTKHDNNKKWQHHNEANLKTVGFEIISQLFAKLLIPASCTTTQPPPVFPWDLGAFSPWNRSTEDGLDVQYHWYRLANLCCELFHWWRSCRHHTKKKTPVCWFVGIYTCTYSVCVYIYMCMMEN